MFRPTIKNLSSILVIGAHPDDIEIGCGGTLLKLLSEHDVHVHWLVLSGDDQRRKEALKSSEHFLKLAKSQKVVIERFRDSYFPASYAEIKDYFVELRHEISPELVFSHRREDQHQDHRLVAELTWNTFRDHLIFEYEIPKFEGDLGQPNIYVSLAEEYCLSKVTSIVESFPSQRSKKLFNSGTLWALMRLRGLEADSMSEFAEGFHCRKLIL